MCGIIFKKYGRVNVIHIVQRT